MNWQRVLDIHSHAATSLAETAERIPREQWLEPRADGKWSPAHVLQHLNLTYDVLIRELEGGTGMAVMTKMWQRIVLRITVVPRILRGGWFPSGARAPREVRPAEAAADQSAAIAAFRERSARFHEAAVAAQARRGVKLSHAYFGKAGVGDSMLLCSRHIEHHERQLSGAANSELAGDREQGQATG